MRIQITLLSKISAQPHTTLCIQFLDRENNAKKKYIATEKTDLFYNSMGLCGSFTLCCIAKHYFRRGQSFAWTRVLEV